MRGKQTAKETVIRKELRETEGARYEYTLTMRESTRLSGFGIPLYAVSVRMNREDTSESEATTSDVFADAGRAIDFFEKAVENLATPIDLAHVLEDSIGI